MLVFDSLVSFCGLLLLRVHARCIMLSEANLGGLGVSVETGTAEMSKAAMTNAKMGLCKLYDVM